MDINTIIIISTNITIAIGIIAVIITLHLNQSKKIDAISDRITKLEIETKIGFEKLNAKFDRLEDKHTNLNQKIEERNTATNKKLDDHIVATNKRIDKLETETKTEIKEQQNTFKEIINKITDVFKNKDVLTEEPQVAV
ncbi:MAG: hypothetical protein FWG85_02750 [Bacteroidetes bacterium]|nr:hypothetical protein [Bacteroidota bacterium]